jgi:hypothetical protein
MPSGTDDRPIDGVLGLHSFPPLGRVSQTDSQSVAFLVVLEVDDLDGDKPWEVCIWHSSGDEPIWEETILSCTPENGPPTRLFTSNGKQLFYHVSLPISRSLHFTLKFRSDPAQPWSWARDCLSLEDGLVLANAGTMYSAKHDLSDVIQGLNPALKVSSVASQTPRTQLWTIEAAAGPACDAESAYTDVELGNPWGSFIR